MDFRDWLESDYYHLLGVNQTASDDEINRAYRLKAKQMHPDIFPLGSVERDEAEQNFKKLIFARDTLLDTEKRNEYDQERQTLQECYVSYISTSYLEPKKSDDKSPPKTSLFKQKLKKVLENEDTDQNYKYDGEVYQNKDQKFENEVLTKEEYAKLIKKDKAREFYLLGLKALGYRDLHRARVYFRSAQYLDPSLGIPGAYLYMIKDNE